MGREKAISPQRHNHGEMLFTPKTGWSVAQQPLTTTHAAALCNTAPTETPRVSLLFGGTCFSLSPGGSRHLRAESCLAEVTGQRCERRLPDCITCDGGTSERRSPGQAEACPTCRHECPRHVHLKSHVRNTERRRQGNCALTPRIRRGPVAGRRPRRRPNPDRFRGRVQQAWRGRQ